MSLVSSGSISKIYSWYPTVPEWTPCSFADVGSGIRGDLENGATITGTCSVRKLTNAHAPRLELVSASHVMSLSRLYTPG